MHTIYYNFFESRRKLETEFCVLKHSTVLYYRLFMYYILHANKHLQDIPILCFSDYAAYKLQRKN